MNSTLRLLLIRCCLYWASLISLSLLFSLPSPKLYFLSRFLLAWLFLVFSPPSILSSFSSFYPCSLRICGVMEHAVFFTRPCSLTHNLPGRPRIQIGSWAVKEEDAGERQTDPGHICQERLGWDREGAKMKVEEKIWNQIIHHPECYKGAIWDITYFVWTFEIKTSKTFSQDWKECFIETKQVSKVLPNLLLYYVLQNIFILSKKYLQIW